MVAIRSLKISGYKAIVQKAISFDFFTNTLEKIFYGKDSIK